MKCLLCDTDFDVEIEEGDAMCPGCEVIYTFGPKQTIINGKLCGLGGSLQYDYTKRNLEIPRNG